MSRPKIREFLHDWAKVELSVGTLDRCIREAGIACAPVALGVSRATASGASDPY